MYTFGIIGRTDYVIVLTISVITAGQLNVNS